MRTIRRTTAIREIAQWFLDQFEKDWNVNEKPGYLIKFEYEVCRRLFAKHWLHAKTMSLINHDRFLMVDDGAWFNRLSIKEGKSPDIAKVTD